MRRPVEEYRARQQVSTVTPLPPPVGGWDAISPLAQMPPNRAVRLDNWFPTPTDIRVRNGHIMHSSGMGSGPVETLMVHESFLPSLSKLFAVTSGSIYDVTSTGEATVSTVTGLANSRLQHINFVSSGGSYLYWVNGADAPQHFNGSVWATPAITGVDETSFVHINAHKNRIWFVVKDSTKAAYLATGAIAGSATEFDLGGLFTKGGHLVAMATWTRDAGDGPDDFAVFVSSRGQVVVYTGIDPADADDWRVVGVFDLAPPIGRRCFTKVGGDLALINQDGVLPLSKALGQDRAAIQSVAVTQRIQNAMASAAATHGDKFGWELVSYPRGTMAILNVPLSAGILQHQYVMNTLTGAWCRFIGQNANTWCVFRDNLYFGGNTGYVLKADTGPIDLSQVIDAVGQTAYNYYKASGLKHWKMIQALIIQSDSQSPEIGISTDFSNDAELGVPTPVSLEEAAQFDSAVWDESVFATNEGFPVNDWLTVLGIGTAAAIHFRVQTGVTAGALWGDALWGSGVWSELSEDEVVCQLNGFNVLYERGGVL